MLTKTPGGSDGTESFEQKQNKYIHFIMGSMIGGVVLLGKLLKGIYNIPVTLYRLLTLKKNSGAPLELSE